MWLINFRLPIDRRIHGLWKNRAIQRRSQNWIQAAVRAIHQMKLKCRSDACEGDMIIIKNNKHLTQHCQPVLEYIFSVMRRVQVAKKDVQ